MPKRPGPHKGAGSRRPGKAADARAGRGGGAAKPSASRRPHQRTSKAAAPRRSPPKSPALEGEERINKVLAHAGFGSRRAVEELILQGRVTVDGEVVRNLATRVIPEQARIEVDGERIVLERPVYFAVHKPKGYVSTTEDPAGRPRVIDLLPEKVPERVFTVGRLDEDSTGLILLTNDGELANKLAHPRYGVEKVYRILVAGAPGPEVLDKLVEGIWLSDGKARARHARFAGKRGDATFLELVLAEGKNREVRRMLAKLGHKVMSLTRISVGPISLKGLPVGECRPLTPRELSQLRQTVEGRRVGTTRAHGPKKARTQSSAPAQGQGIGHIVPLKDKKTARPSTPSRPKAGVDRSRVRARPPEEPTEVLVSPFEDETSTSKRPSRPKRPPGRGRGKEPTPPPMDAPTTRRRVLGANLGPVEPPASASKSQRPSVRPKRPKHLAPRKRTRATDQNE